MPTMPESFSISSRSKANDGGLTVRLSPTGASVVGITFHRLSGDQEVILSYPNLLDYQQDHFYMGATVGPVANRLRDGRFQLFGEQFDLDINESNRSNLLHGGALGLHQQVFQRLDPRAPGKLSFSLTLDHLSDGFPGNRSVTVDYALAAKNRLSLDFTVTTDRPTVVNLANHAYFNLGGALGEHELNINGAKYTPVDDRLLPTGNVECVKDASLDFRNWQPLGDRQLDHNLVLSEDSGLRHAASLRLVSTGVQLDVLTTQPALQVYTGDGLDAPFKPRAGICLEAQGYPDAPNCPEFPSIVLDSGERYFHRTVYELSDLRLN